jgi:hypothetical protein
MVYVYTNMYTDWPARIARLSYLGLNYNILQKLHRMLVPVQKHRLKILGSISKKPENNDFTIE